MAARADADDLLRWMTDHGRFRVQRWLRAEQLTGDVLALLDDLGEGTCRSTRLRDAQTAIGAYSAGNADPPKNQFSMA